MAIITVTATVTFDYDTEESLVDSTDAALEDVQDAIDNGEILSGQFIFTVTTEGK